MVSRAMSWMSTYVVVEISPETTTRPVFTSVSHATRPVGSSRSTASRTPSEIWSATLSGCPSVTDSEVNRYSLSAYWLMKSRKSSDASACAILRSAVAALAFVEVDDQRHAIHAEPRAQPVLDEVGVVARHPVARVHLDREPRWAHLELGHVEHSQPVPLLGRGLARLHRLGEEAVELGRGDAGAHPIAEVDRLGQHAT